MLFFFFFLSKKKWWFIFIFLILGGDCDKKVFLKNKNTKIEKKKVHFYFKSDRRIIFLLSTCS